MTPLTNLFPPEHLLSRFLKNDPYMVDLYSGHFFNEADWKSVIEKRTAFPAETRKALHAAMVRQNTGISDKTDQNLAKLALKNTVVIVTGQQAGFFGGPFYTLLKTLSAIKWAEDLSARFPETNFVPVFWLEVEDHDFKEIAVYKQPELQGLTFPENENEAYFQISARTVPAHFSDFIDQVSSQLPETDFKAGFIEKLNNAFQSGKSFADAFLAFVRDWFADFGLLVLNPSDPEIKRLGLPVFTKELQTQIAGKSVTAQTKSMVERSIPVQLTPRSINLFMIRNGRRSGLELLPDQKIKLAGTNEVLSSDEILNRILENPALISPNVVTRPLFQDTVLPTAGVILGPGEFSYWGQLQLAYQQTQTVMPICIPRTSGVFIEPAVQRLLEKFSITPEQIIKNPEWSEIEFRKLTGTDVASEFDQIKSELTALFSDRKTFVKSIDPTLEDPWNGLSARTIQTIEQFYSRLDKAVRKTQDVTVNQMKRLDANLLPDGIWQERSVSSLYFLVKYGPGLIKDLYGQVTTEAGFHIFKSTVQNIQNRVEESR